MIRIRLVSDLHFESVRYPGAFSLPGNFDVLAVVGDVYRSRPEDAAREVARLSRGRAAVMVMGNHEPWGMRIPEARSRLSAACAAEGVVLLDDGSATVCGIRFVGGTLWTDGVLGGFRDDYPTGRTGEGIVNDAGEAWTIVDAVAAHESTLSAIEKELGIASSVPTVVMTHHAPLRECLKRPDIGPVAGITASDLSHLVDSGKAAAWLHGHVHHSLDMVRPGGTRVCCNPAGTGFSNPDFREDFEIHLA